MCDSPDWYMQQHLLDEQLRWEQEEMEKDPAYDEWIDSTNEDKRGKDDGHV